MTSRDLRAWMWEEACELLNRADRMHRQFFQLGESQPRFVWQPPVDIFETGRELFVFVALPGVTPEQARVIIEDNALIVAGERPLPEQVRLAGIQRLEIPYGYFERRIQLPSGHFELRQRDLVDGCLRLTLYKLTAGT